MTLICLPPNTTQITQPLDVSFFRPLKEYWNQLLIDWRIDHVGDQLPCSEIAPLLHKAVEKMDNLKSVLSNGFRRCGIHPWDANAVNCSVLLHPLNPVEANQENSENDSVPSAPQTTAGQENLLTGIQNYMTQQQIDVFNRSIFSGKWFGTREEISLFEVWQKIIYGQISLPLASMSGFPVQIPVRSSLDAEPPFEGLTEDRSNLFSYRFLQPF